MADPIEGQNPAPEASAPQAPVTEQQPAAESQAAPFDPAALEAKLLAQFDQRIAGVQSGYQQQINERDERIRELETASLSEEERDELAEQEAEQYVSQLEMQVALQNLSEQYPKAAPHLRKLIEFGSAEEQAQYLEQLFAPAESESEPAENVPPVDANNPSTPVDESTFISPDGQPMTKEMRKRLLESFGDTPLASIRRG